MMAEINTILFATDYSRGAKCACDMVRTLAQQFQAHVWVLHVITEFADRQSRYLSTEVIDSLIREVEQHAVADMHRFGEQQFAGIAFSTEVVLGKADVEILRFATQISADLIVMGTHGRTGVEQLFVGSTAEKVVRRSLIPVLTIRE